MPFSFQIELANKYFGPQLLFMIIQTRIQLITDGYKVVTALTPEGSSYFESVFEVCFQWIRLFQIVYLSERVIQQVKQYSATISTAVSWCNGTHSKFYWWCFLPLVFYLLLPSGARHRVPKPTQPNHAKTVSAYFYRRGEISDISFGGWSRKSRVRWKETQDTYFTL